MGVRLLLTSESGYFWFSDPANVEVVVKVLDWCPGGDIKFFAAGLTNFRVEMDVTDTQTGLTKHYGNPQGVAFRPIQDTFSSCPPGNIAGAWTGTYNGISNRCNTDAQARFEQTGSAVSGELRTTGSCGLAVGFSGTLQGNTLAGSVTDGEIFSGDARGIL